MFLAKLDAAGGHRWSKRFGDAHDELGITVAADGAGNALLTGDLDGTIDFGLGPLVSAGALNMFVAKFAP